MKTDTPAVTNTQNDWPSHLAATGLCIAVALVSWPLARWLDLAGYAGVVVVLLHPDRYGGKSGNHNESGSEAYRARVNGTIQPNL